MRRFWIGVAAVAVLAGYAWTAAREAEDREAARPEPAPIGVTVDPGASLGTARLADGGFDFAAVRWTPERRQEAAAAVEEIKGSTGLAFSFFVPDEAATAAAFDVLAGEYPRDRWFTYRGKPLVYVFGPEKIPEDTRFSIIRIDNGPMGEQYWVSNPPNLRRGLLTLVPSFTGGGLEIDPRRTGDALDQQEFFAETNKDRVALLLWHSWNVAEDGSALLPGLVAGTDNPPAYAYDRVKAFNGRWQQP